jgi:two-component system cell cycle response regulator DivK
MGLDIMEEAEGRQKPIVLVIDAGEMARRFVRDVLSHHGYDIVDCRDDADALSLARRHHPAAILIDVQFPGCSALGVAIRMKEDDDLKSIPIIAASASAVRGDEGKLRAGGCHAYLAKPMSVRDLLETVARFVDNS